MIARSAPSGVQIRRARPGDAANVYALVQELGYRPDERSFDETFAQVVRHPEAIVLVAAEGQRVLGYLALSHRPQIHLGGRSASIDALAVSASRRGTRIGAALVAQALDFARGLGCRRVELSCSRSREAYSRGFYAKQGFVEIDSALYRIE